jgi:putative endonuclease
MPDSRRALGALGEDIAVKHLERAGYEIVARNYRTRYGELDIVAGIDRWFVFCEVKTRVAGGRGGYDPFDSIGAVKQGRIRKMAAQWLAEGRDGPAGPRRDLLRFDAIGISVRPDGSLLALNHLEDAF